MTALFPGLIVTLRFDPHHSEEAGKIDGLHVTSQRHSLQDLHMSFLLQIVSHFVCTQLKDKDVTQRKLHAQLCLELGLIGVILIIIPSCPNWELSPVHWCTQHTEREAALAWLANILRDPACLQKAPRHLKLVWFIPAFLWSDRFCQSYLVRLMWQL